MAEEFLSDDVKNTDSANQVSSSAAVNSSELAGGSNLASSPPGGGVSRLFGGGTLVLLALGLLAAGVFGFRYYQQQGLPWLGGPAETTTLPTPSLAPGETRAPVPTTEAGEMVDFESAQKCDKGYIFSQKDCRCVPDSGACAGLLKDVCEKRAGCFSYSRSGTCLCPDCESFLEHQCLPE